MGTTRDPMKQEGKWHVLDQAGNESGPYTAEQLRSYEQDGTVSPATWVWSAGLSDWIPASEVEGLFESKPNRPRLLTGTAAPAPRQPIRTPTKLSKILLIAAVILSIGATAGFLPCLIVRLNKDHYREDKFIVMGVYHDSEGGKEIRGSIKSDGSSNGLPFNTGWGFSSRAEPPVGSEIDVIYNPHIWLGGAIVIEDGLDYFKKKEPMRFWSWTLLTFLPVPLVLAGRLFIRLTNRREQVTGGQAG